MNNIEMDLNRHLPSKISSCVFLNSARPLLRKGAAALLAIGVRIERSNILLIFDNDSSTGLRTATCLSCSNGVSFSAHLFGSHQCQLPQL
jgi:hypothetical protein